MRIVFGGDIDTWHKELFGKAVGQKNDDTLVAFQNECKRVRNAIGLSTELGPFLTEMKTKDNDENLVTFTGDPANSSAMGNTTQGLERDGDAQTSPPHWRTPMETTTLPYSSREAE